jgi:hypothetical protein
MNLLQALPKTPLWDRLAREERLVDDPALESNVRFLRPYDDVIGTWRRCIAYTYDPDRIFTRFRHQVDATYKNRMVPPAAGRLTWNNLRFALIFALRIAYYIGLRSNYRRQFWHAARYALRHGHVDAMFGMAFIGHHLIEFTREALRGEQNASFYSQARKERATARAMERERVPESA